MTLICIQILKKYQTLNMDSTIDIQIIACRVCLCEDDMQVISPCDCNGTGKYIHNKCLDKWILISGNGTTCPTCKSRYKDEFIVDTRSMEKKQFFIDEIFNPFANAA